MWAGFEPATLGSIDRNMLPMGHPDQLHIINPYSAMGLGDRLYATLHKMPGEVEYSFFYFRSRKTLHYTHLEATSYIPQQGQSLHF